MAHQHHKHATCRDLLGQISDYIDGELEAKLCAELEAHLADCEDCRVMVDTTRKTVVLFRRQYQAEPVALPKAINQRLQNALAQAGCLKD